jgi:NAD(P)-dependent dehydrogenase (short-subunit alcohol dehydrogenase family)
MIWHAARYWIEQRETGMPIAGSIVNTTSRAALEPEHHLFARYGAVKGAIAAVTMTTHLELRDHGIRVNAIAPHAFTRAEAHAKNLSWDPDREQQGFEPLHPDNIGPMVAWLGSDDAASVSGEIFFVEGGLIARYVKWPKDLVVTRDRPWDPAAIGPALRAAQEATR